MSYKDDKFTVNYDTFMVKADTFTVKYDIFTVSMSLNIGYSYEIQ